MPRTPAKLDEYRRKRDFARTAEPAGDERASSRDALRFVIQKHAASRLHFDFRLELDGVMKSWAIPKGPSLDPAVKRLAMEVEDHPIEYNTFEGTIPKGQYGGGTVMLWDRGTYEPGGEDAADGPKALRRGYRAGNLKVFLRGERLVGGFALVRMRAREPGDKPQWLLVKELDDWADRERDIVAEVDSSVESGLTMDEITKDPARVWQSDRAEAAPGTDTGAEAGSPRSAKSSAGKPASRKKRGSAKSSAGKPASRKRSSAKKATRATAKGTPRTPKRKSTGGKSNSRRGGGSAGRAATSGRPTRRK